LLLAADAPVERIAKLLGVSERSFHRHYKRDVEMALTEQVAILNTRLMAMTMGIARNANRGAVRAAIFTVDKMATER
jgi:AraC-like DNA-binding protein